MTTKNVGRDQEPLRRDAGPNKRGLKVRAEELLAERQGGLPIWIRAPKSGTEHYCGLSRSKLYEGATKGFFRSVSIREPGQLKGTRLFHLGSILKFIELHEDVRKVESANGTGGQQ
jgi:hypothetical protein